MEFYHNLITDKSFQLLQDLRKKYNFFLPAVGQFFFIPIH